MGAREVNGLERVPAAVDSEYRFYAAWYFVTGVAVLRRSALVVTRSDIDLLSTGLGTAVLGRLLSLSQSGRPKPGQQTLLGVEVALVLALLATRRRVPRSPV